jgi:CHAD domain-containing protein
VATAAGAAKKARRVSRKRKTRLLDSAASQAATRIARDFLDDVREARRRLKKHADADALHDFRVALRRLRSTLRAYRPWLGSQLTARKLRKGLRRLARASGSARDAEVGLVWFRRERNQASASERLALDRLIADFDMRRAAAYAEFQTKLDQEFASIEHRLNAALRRSSTRAAAAQRLAPVFGRLLERQLLLLSAELRRITSVADTEAIHSARIAGKRLRYLLEPLAPELRSGKTLLNVLKRFQDEFGELCDRQVLSAELIGLIARHQAERTIRRLRSVIGELAEPAPRRSTTPSLRRILERLGAERARRFRSIERRYLGRHVDALLLPYHRLALRLADPWR